MNPKRRLAALVAAATTSWGALSMAGPQAAPPHGAAAPRPSGKVTKPPKLVKFIQAPFPESERDRTKKAAVVLAIAIGDDGKVVDATVVDSAGPAFDDAAVAAAKQFEFTPAEIEGVPAPVRIQYRYDFVLTVEAPPAPTTADFGGVVRDRKSGKPLPGVSVSLDDATTKTDENGRFQFPAAAPGVHSVTLAGPDFTPVGTEETLVVGHKYDATYDVDVAGADVPPEQRVDFEIVVVDTHIEKSVGSVSVSAEQGAKVAGTGGDVIKVVENLPGVARSSVGSGALVVWGAGAQDTRVYIDDVHIPLLYHEGGFRSVIHSDLVQNVELEPGGYGAAHGRGLGGLVTVGMRPLEADGYHGSVSVDAIDAAASLRGSVGDKFRFALAGRRSHLDTVLAHVTSEDVGDIVPIPKYWDGQARLAYVPNEAENVEVGTLLSSDHINRSLIEADPSDTKRQSKDTGFQRVYMRYTRHMDDGSSVTVTPFFGFNHASTLNVFGALPAELDNDATVYGLRATWTGQPTDFLGLTAGIDTEVERSALRRHGSVTSPPREGDIFVFGQTPSRQTNDDTWSTTVGGLAPFVQADLSAAKGTFHLLPGARLEPSVISTSRTAQQSGTVPPIGNLREDTQIEPRIAARWSVTDKIRIRAAAGIYHQAPLAEDLSAVFGNPNLNPSKAVHYLGGVAFQLSKPISVELTSFYEKQTNLATRSPLPAPIAAQALVQGGLGRAYGTQILIRHDLTDRFFGWISYTISRSERTDGGSTEYRPFDFDQTHVFTALASYDLGKGFEIGSRFRYSTGYPRTPVIGTDQDATLTDAVNPVFGVHNSIRIPGFYQLDARLSKSFSFGENTKLEVYLDVQNVTNHGNPEEIVYNYNYTQKAYITGLPILPVIGGKLSW